MRKSELNTTELLSHNEYWGRGILIGNYNDKVVVAYFIMGRSENSRNRYFYMKEDSLAIAPFDDDKMEDPSLIIYYPIKFVNDYLIVTNGDQTDTIEECLKEGKSFRHALSMREYEPDAPHYTSRISGIVDLRKGEYELSILKKMNTDEASCARYYYNYPSVKGVGNFIHTYESNGDPLPAFQGEPWLISFDKDIDDFSESIWNSLDAENKISLCVMYIDDERNNDVRLFNKRKGD